MSTMTNERLGISAPATSDLVERHHLHDLVRDVGARALTAAGLVGIGLIHLLDSIGKYGETRYLFWMYIGLILGSLAVAGAVLHSRSRLVWLAAAGLAASALAGYVINRTVGMPNATGDIGNWTEPLGLASLFVEAAVIATSLYGQQAPRA
jgi:hypothetical protein